MKYFLFFCSLFFLFSFFLFFLSFFFLNNGRKSAVLMIMAEFMSSMHSSQGVYMHSVLQELGYMARRRHKTGIISTYEYTWLLKADEGGVMKVSDAIHCSRQGDGHCASVTEVSKLCHQSPNGGKPPVNDRNACMFSKHATLAPAILTCMPPNTCS